MPQDRQLTDFEKGLVERIAQKKEQFSATPPPTAGAPQMEGQPPKQEKFGAGDIFRKIEERRSLVPEFNKPATSKPTRQHGFFDPFLAGVGDVMSASGSALDFFGADSLGSKFQEKGAGLQQKYTNEEALQEVGEFDWNDLLDPTWYHQVAFRGVPSALSLMPAALAGAYAGTAAAGTAGLGAFGTTVMGALGGAALSRPIEGAMEAGETYQEALRRGMSEAEANDAAEQVFTSNLMLSGLDAGELAAAFMPSPFKAGGKVLRGAQMAGRVAVPAALEAGEEIAQASFQKRALGDPFSLKDPEVQEAGVLGGLFGGALGTAGNVFTMVKEQTINNMPPRMKKDFQGHKGNEMSQGLDEQAAELKALDTIATREDGALVVQETINKMAEEQLAQQQQKITKPAEGTQTTDGEPTPQKQTRIIDQKILKPELVTSRLNDVAMKIARQETGDTQATTPITSAIRSIPVENMDSPGQFYRAVESVLRENNANTKESLTRLNETTRDFFMLDKNDQPIYTSQQETQPQAVEGQEAPTQPAQLPEDAPRPTIAEENEVGLAHTEALQRAAPPGTRVGANKPREEDDGIETMTVIPQKLQPTARSIANKDISKQDFINGLREDAQSTTKTRRDRATRILTNLRDAGITASELYDTVKRGAALSSGATSQQQKVAQVTRGKAKSIKQIAEETGILEPNVRRILGTGAKDGVFERVDRGVYILTQEDGTEVAWIHTADAVEALPRLAEEGLKADMIFLDIPYKTPAVVGGNRGIKKYSFITPQQFEKIVASSKKIARTKDTPVYYMYSQAPSGLRAMAQYTDKLTAAGFKPIAKGEYTKLQKDGLTRLRNMRGDLITPEGIMLFNQSGKFNEKDAKRNLNFNLVRPAVAGKKGYQTQKPAELARALILQGTKEGDTVLDPFAGSGVVPSEAVRAGRKTVAIEARKEAVEGFIKPRTKTAAREAQAAKTKRSASTSKKLPRELAGAKPRYNFGSKAFTLDFSTDVDKALYIVAQKTPSKRDADYLRFLQGAFPELSVDDIRQRGQIVRNFIKNLARDSEPGELQVAPVVAPRRTPSGYASDAGYADIPLHEKDAEAGGMADNEYNTQRDINETSEKLGIEMPELVKLYKELTAGAQVLLKNFRGGTRGKFWPIPTDPKVGLDRSLFVVKKDESDRQAAERVAKTMAHELGHLVDYLPEQDMKRGNITGRLLSLRSMRKEFFSFDEKVMDQRQKLVRKIGELRRAVERGENTFLNSQEQAKLQDQLDRMHEKMFVNKKYREELYELTKLWRPFDENRVSESYVKYRKSSAELYADFVSALFTRPDIAKNTAPKFYKDFFEALDRKPEVKQAYFEAQLLLRGERQELIKQRYDDLVTMFKSSDEAFRKKLEADLAGRVNPWYLFKKQFIYEHQWAREHKKKYREFAEQNPGIAPEYWMEQLDFLGGIVYGNAIEDLNAPLGRLQDAGISHHELSAVLFAERIAKGESRQDIANPLGHNIKTSQEMLEKITEVVGADKAAVMFDVAKDLRAGLKRMMLKYKDLYTPEMLERIEGEEFYAPFNVLTEVGTRMPSALKHQTGNLNETNDITTNLVLKYAGIIHAGEKNSAAKQTRDWIKNVDGSVVEADYSYDQNKKMRVPKDPDSATLGLLTVMDEGKMRGYYVDKEIADSFAYRPIGEYNMILKYAFMMPNRLMKPIMTTINPGFQVVNIIRDMMTFKKQPQVSWGKLMNYYLRALPEAYKKAWRKPSETIDQMFKDGLLNVDNSGRYRFASDKEVANIGQLEYVLNAMGLRPAEQSSKLDVIPLYKQGRQLINFMQQVGEMIEATPKVAGYTYLQETQIFASEAQRKHWVRDNIGSPNFFKVSGNHAVNNNIALFYNAIVRGLERTFRTASTRETRSAFWWHMAKYSVIPAVLSVMAEEGVFGEDLENKYRKISEYMKNNYISIPLKIDDTTNKVVSFSIPMAEEDRFVHAAVRMALKGMTGDWGEKGNSILQLASYTGGQVPSLAPQADLLFGWSVAMTGGNPYDYFRDQHVFSMNEERADLSVKGPIMLMWSLEKTGLSSFFRFTANDRIANTTVAERTIKATPIINRFVRVSNYGEYEANQMVKEKVETAAATKRVKRNNQIADWANKYFENPEPIEQYIPKVAGDVLKDEDVTPENIRSVRERFVQEIMIGINDPNVNSLMTGSNDAKVALLKDLYKELPSPQFTRLLETSARTKAISEEVLRDFATWMQVQKQ